MTYHSLTCPHCNVVLPAGTADDTCPFCHARLQPASLEPPENLTGDEAVEKGIAAYHAEKYIQAVQHFNQALDRLCYVYEGEFIYTMLGLCFQHLQQCLKAIEYQRRSLEINPRFYKAWVNMGIAYRKNGNLDEAERCYRHALEIEPGYAAGHASLGALYIFRDEAKQAIAACERAIQLDPTLAVAYGNLSLAYAMAGNFDEAEQQLKKAVARGYKEYAEIRQRIDALKGLQE